MRSKRGMRLAAAAFERLPVAATATDRRGRVLAVNREARRLAGRRLKRGEAPPCREYWGCARGAKCPLLTVRRTGRTVYHAVVRSRGPGGEPRTMVERASPALFPGGKRGAVVVCGPATAYFRRYRQLREKAFLDALTGTLNRRRFDELSRGERRHGRAAFLMLDVDGLKRVNDQHGHSAGDALLRRIGGVLSRHTRRGDLVGRVGGDEFAVYMPGADSSRARRLAARLRAAMAADNAAHPGAPRLSAQIGIACGTTACSGALRRRADDRLCALKRRLKSSRERAR